METVIGTVSFLLITLSKVNITEIRTIIKHNLSQISIGIAIAVSISIIPNHWATAQTLEANQSTHEPINPLDNPLDKREDELVGNMEQVNRVSELRDLKPGDWPYEALRNLSERYGCIHGYPNDTYQGNATITRYEFAVGLNSCLNKMRKLLASERGKIVTEDIATLERLLRDYRAELTKLNSRTEELATTIEQLESKQFSTTSKLQGNLRVQANTFFSGDNDPQTNIQYNLFLNQLTSFTGKDSLSIALASTNTVFPELASNNSGTNFGSTREGASDTSSAGDTGNSLRLIRLEYQFPLGDKTLIDIVATSRYRFSPILLKQFFPGYMVGQGPVSSFAEAPPLYLLGGGSGVVISHEFLDSAVLTLTYLSNFANQPQSDRGLFNGDYIAAAQINFNPSPNLFVQLLYHHGNFDNGNFGFFNGKTFEDNGFIGTALANRFDDPGVFFADGDIKVGQTD